MRRVRRKGGNKEKVFGCDLLEHLNASSQEIPQVLRCCSEFVETHGIVDGIYRLSGVSSNIQKLRGEFENDATPDLNKDVYLQDIHCVSSLCKAYFRELPNPLLTYQLYDKFAEAVAIQLEEERLVKIRDVLKELPKPHYRTLEFLMRHLVRMASYSSETNMHARNLAIVWAPNLLRSKDIEVSGFNGTAAFMEVRVQSIVVEFVLTHVPQLFPEHGVTSERRKSLPSPSAACAPEEGFFKSAPSQPIPHFGNISPGDGPIPIRPYHAIIEGTDKRKGSLKGRKWMSIFNIGGRFHDPRRRHKHSAKEKERPVLRPARSMDSLSSPSYPNEGSRRSAQRPPSTSNSTVSPLVTTSHPSGAEVTASSGALGGSEYAVTYRRGTGLVSGGAGTQGTYTALDPEGLGLSSGETLQSRSPGLSTKVGRRAAMHITGPTMVTVPLHITSNLALGVLQGGGGDRVIHRGRDKDGGDRVEGKEGGEKVERSDSRGMEKKVEGGRKVAEEEKNHRGKESERDGGVKAEEKTSAGCGEEEGGEGQKDEKKEEAEEECRWKPEVVVEGPEQRAKSVTSNKEEDTDGDAVHDKDVDENSDYMDMKGMMAADFPPEVAQHADDQVFDASEILNSTEVEGDDLGLSGYVQDNFEFLDQMDCSVLDHMDCSVSYQVNEFSVEPPGHSDDEYEVMDQAHPSHYPAEPQTHLQPEPEPQLNPHRPLSLDLNSRHTKSLSLPYMTSPVHGPDESSSESEATEDDSDENGYSSEEDESMFVKSLPCDFFLKDLDGFEANSDIKDSYAPDVPVHQLQISDDLCRSVNPELPACEEPPARDEEQAEVRDEEDEDAVEEKEMTTEEGEDKVPQERDRLENNRQSEATDEDHSVTEDHHNDKGQSTDCCPDCPPLSDDESSTMADITVEKEKEVFDHSHGRCSPCHTVCFATEEESKDASADETEHPRPCDRDDANEKDSDEVEDGKACREIGNVCQEIALEIKENDGNMLEETSEGGNEASTHDEKMQEAEKERENPICGTGRDIWDELEEVICDLIEDEESKQVEKKDADESVAEEESDPIEDVKAGEEDEQTERESVEGEWEVDGGETNETEESLGVMEELAETTEDGLKDTEVQREIEERETSLPKTSEATQKEHASNDEARHHDREVVSQEKENKVRAKEQQKTPLSVDQVRPDMKEIRRCEESDSGQRGWGRKLVVSKHPKVHQVKAVPVVPPKPQHCKITALTLRQQQQQRERRDADRGGRENSAKVPTERERVCAGDAGTNGKDGDEGCAMKERPTLRGHRDDRDESAARDANRNSPLSMCFDEAVAIATMRRGKEKECEKERERQKEWGNEIP